MRSIADALKTGDTRTRLAVVADLVSILGVSLATVVGGGFALNGRLDVASVVGLTITSLLSLALASVVVVCFLSASHWLRGQFQARYGYFVLLQIALWAVFTALFVWAAFLSYEVLSSIRLTR